MTDKIKYPTMTGAKLAFLNKLASDKTANSLLRKLALLDISHLGRPALEPLVDFVEGTRDDSPVRRYAIDLLKEFDRRHGSNGLNEDDKGKLARVLQNHAVAMEGLA
jgi:hypothetical protein